MTRRAAGPLLLVVGLCALLVAVTIGVGSSTSGDDRDPSSLAAGRSGTLALYTWLGRLGFDVHRVDGTLDLGGSDVLVCDDPLAPFTGSEADTVASFLDGGGDVVLAGSSPDLFGPLLTRYGIAVDGATGSRDATPAQPFSTSGAVRDVPVRPPQGSAADSLFGDAVTLHGARATPLLDAGGAVAIGMSAGAGHLWMLGSTYPLSNDGLRRGDSAPLVLALLERARGGRIAFDEVHHFGSSQQGGLGTVITGSLALAALLAVAVVLAAMISGGRRLGRPLPARDPTRVPSAAEQIASVGHLYSRSRRRGAVAERYAEELKRRVGTATGADPHLDDAAFTAAVSTYGAERADVTARVLAEARALAAAAPSESQLVALARRVDACERDWAAPAR